MYNFKIIQWKSTNFQKSKRIRTRPFIFEKKTFQSTHFSNISMSNLKQFRTKK